MDNIDKIMVLIEAILVILQLAYILTSTPSVLFIIIMIISWIIIAYTIYIILRRK